jgi:hypothetical protein
VEYFDTPQCLFSLDHLFSHSFMWDSICEEPHTSLFKRTNHHRIHLQRVFGIIQASQWSESIGTSGLHKPGLAESNRGHLKNYSPGWRVFPTSNSLSHPQCVSSIPKILLANLSFNLTHRVQRGKLLDSSTVYKRTKK